ncbi:dynein heavy chain, cytoplasmic-like isoform X2 [Gordionus sp. m RMFG-2023]|uniref:dynein heavy chain, cytoplasmic-like isoform X2 n=1 Tax=Gordionus sp. m RMFG-2023 TaxID=3053472 RepID=UPI0031FDA67B
MDNVDQTNIQDGVSIAAADKFIDINKFYGYLYKIILCLFDDDNIITKIPESQATLNGILAKIECILADKDNFDKIKKFIQDPQTSSLFIQKFQNKEDEEMNDATGDNILNEEPFNFTIIISNEIHYTNDRVTSLALIKKGKIIEADKRIYQQIRLLNLSDDSPYETLRSFVGEAVAPYFKSYVRHSDVVERESDKMAPLVEKKIAELEMGLLHLQQNIEIPEIVLSVHPAVKQVLDICKAENRKPKIEDFDDKINDSAFLNSLQNQVNRWIREIQKVTKLEKDPSSGSALQEITFWLNMEHALLKIQEKRESLEVNLSLDILKQGKRFHATVSFDTDTGLKQALDLVGNYNLLMRDFPINDLLSAPDLDSIANALTQIFIHMKKVRSTRYPVNRVLRLLEALSRDLNNQIKKVLSYKQNLLGLPYDDFEKLMVSALNVFVTWDEHYEKLLTLVREMNKKKGDPLKLIMRVNLIHKKLSNRMAILEKFRKQHEQLRTVISRVLKQQPTASAHSFMPNPEPSNAINTNSANNRFLDISDVGALKEIAIAYDNVKDSIMDPLQVTKEADEAWDMAMKRYDEKIDRIEARITAQLRDQLGVAKNANEMFRIFSRYNALFVRPRIRGAIREYQTQLIQHVKKDIENLKEKFKIPYNQTKACKLSVVRDIPPVSGHIIWVRQIERRLDTYTKRIGDILGKDWETHLEGRNLKAEADAFRLKLLDSDSLFDEWASRVQSRNYTVSGRIFNVESSRELMMVMNRECEDPNEGSINGQGTGSNISMSSGTAVDVSSGVVFRYKLKVNFLPEIITLAKEVRNLKSLGYRISVAIMTNANKASQAYPLAISLMENVRAYEQTCAKIGKEDSNFELLAAKLRKDAQTKISEGIGLLWDSFKLEGYVPQFSDTVFFFQEKVDELIEIYEKIGDDLRSLETCPFNQQIFAEKVDSIQRSVDNLSLKQFSNLPCWIGRLDGDIGKRLAFRLQEGIKAWTERLIKGEEGTSNNRADDADTDDNIDEMIDNFSANMSKNAKIDLESKSINNNYAQQDHNTGYNKIRRNTQGTKTQSVHFKALIACPGGEPKIMPLIHEFRISNQVIYLNPPIEDAREKLLEQFFSYIGIVLSLPRVTSSRYNYEYTTVSDIFHKPFHENYQNLLSQLPEGPTVIQTCYQAQESVLNKVKVYVDQWFRYQSLWDLQSERLYDKLGQDLPTWIDCLIDIRRTRETFDTTDTNKKFGPIVIEFGKVQSKVTLKYDSWHKEVLSKFGLLLNQEMQSLYSTISKARVELEQKHLDGSTSTSQAVSLVTYVQTLKSRVKAWERRVNEEFKEGQLVLEKHRFTFPNDWLHLEQVEGEWNAFRQILERKSGVIQNQVAHLQTKILAEDSAVSKRCDDLINEWEICKPVDGSLLPDSALKTLNLMEAKFNESLKEKSNITRAKEALGLSDNDMLSASGKDKTKFSLEELQDLKGVWIELKKIWEQLEALKETSWASVQPRKVRQSLDSLSSSLKSLPTHLRQYSAYEYVKRLIQSYSRANVLIVELKSDAIKERHWKRLARKLQPSSLQAKSQHKQDQGSILQALNHHQGYNVKSPFESLLCFGMGGSGSGFGNELTLGHVWDLDLVRNEKDIKDVILVAQGEMALEQFLVQVRETWQNYELDMVNYQNKCRLIRGWDDLFNKLKEHINSLAAMKLSPYFKEFEEDAISWEDKLNRLNSLFDIWIDVQRKWVYLEAIFTGSNDIKNLLPNETSRFQSISSEFSNLLKRVSKSPLVLDVLNIPGIQRSLERLSDFLCKIQKALGEYLERKRTSFPRFYFIGDEDLLEIIGNGKNLPKLQKHFKKMFAGISSLIYESASELETSQTSAIYRLTGLCSKEGEKVMLTRPLELREETMGKVNEWLATLENEIKLTLAETLANSVTSVRGGEGPYFFREAKESEAKGDSDEALLNWIDKYQAQIIILTLQIIWTETIENSFNTELTYFSKSQNKPTPPTLQNVLQNIDKTLAKLADFVLRDQPTLRRRKMEHMITELVHKRDLTRELIINKVDSIDSFDWLKHMRFYFAPTNGGDKRLPEEGARNKDMPSKIIAESLLLDSLVIEISTARFSYGWEYLGFQEKLVQTPLTDKCYLAMTQALEARLGGSPFGPAGTGKTESVKALGHALGRFVLVFNCDETFDFQAMGRIFIGLCQVGAWGCFDEFNRLEERILSAISQQIQTIQMALKELANQNTNQNNNQPISIELVGKSVTINPHMAIFVTMNPGYAGRSNLPDNLKKLFRRLAMTTPDVHLISEVLLFSQGFRKAEQLARKVVPLFKLCAEQLSNQTHYDFGLRALKSVLTSAGNIKRERIKCCVQDSQDLGSITAGMSEDQLAQNEKEILIQSVCETLIPKLVSEDIPLLKDLLRDVFPGVSYEPVPVHKLKSNLVEVCRRNHLAFHQNLTSNENNIQNNLLDEDDKYTDNTSSSCNWADKVIQLYHLTQLHHGIMLVGPSGSGKTTAWRTLFSALENLNPSSKTISKSSEGNDNFDNSAQNGDDNSNHVESLSIFGGEGCAHVIDPKAVSKEALYGTLDPNTREWTDGLFTGILRKIIDNVRGEINKRQWIVFDGDVDPEWVENLNSVLDDNKLLTLPNGERLNIPPNVRIIFEVQDLKYATMATVSRCGMIWFSERVLTDRMIYFNYLEKLRSGSADLSTNFDTASTNSKIFSNTLLSANSPSSETNNIDIRRAPAYNNANGVGSTGSGVDSGLGGDFSENEVSAIAKQVQTSVAKILELYFTPNGMVSKALEYAKTLEHIMDFTRLRALNSLFSLLNQGVRNIVNYQLAHPDFPMNMDAIERYTQSYLIYSLLWSFAGDSKLKCKEDLGEFIQSITTIPLPNKANSSIIDYELNTHGEWVAWSLRVPNLEIDTHKVANPDCVIPTVDTARHESLLYTWLAEHKPIILCGPPGSGKTMTLFNALRSLNNDMEVIGLNFSSATTPELLLKTLDHYCEYRKTSYGMVLSPIQYNKWLVLFCDEINLPDMDKYGTQRVISFLRQILEHGGFYKTTTNNEQIWVKTERIQFVGACNPPTDPGRKPLSHRLLRHIPVIYVDYPGSASLFQIYNTFNKAMLKLMPSLRSYSEPLTNAMIEFYLTFQDNFTQDMQPHYIFSPRELTRWVRGIYEAIKPLENLSLDGLVRLWAHEGLRLFQDRLVNPEERVWTDETLDTVALKHFPTISRETLKRPILYSNWLSKDYIPVNLEELRQYTKARLKIFYEEELDVQLVLYDDVFDHVLRIDRVFRQPQGHVLLIGISGSGKTTLSRFVAWMNGLSIFQIKVHNKYRAEDFDEDLRNILKRAGCKGEKITFIMDESNVLDSSFLERINTLLANGEVPGLFEGDLYSALMTQCKEGSQREGLMLDSNEELYKWFTNQVMRNLHVVFTMNPSSQGLKERSSTSPALFNRCVINWFGDWSNLTLFQVGKELTIRLDLDNPEYQPPPGVPLMVASDNLPLNSTLTYRDALINSFVYVHQTLHQANERLIKRQGRSIYITPRHYLDFIIHYVKLYHEKRSDLEDEQLHLNVGLHKIRDTVEQVEELQKSLALKRQELETKNAMANAKLKDMIKDQQEAEMRKSTSQQIQSKLIEQEKLIHEKKQMAINELAQVEPAVIEAQQAVKGIRKQPLVEVRSMANPPLAVKMAMESICLLLGENYSDWKAIRGVIMKDNFIPMILNFSTDDISEFTRIKFINTYLNNPDYNYEKIARASQACGPLVKWAIAQINYADMLQKVDPLRNELKKLEKDAEENRLKANKIDDTIQLLEKSIANYKEEYAVLISQAQSIKHDLETVQTKVDRSVALLSNLESERSRWDSGTRAFRSRLATLPGDSLMNAAFLAYAGYFDQAERARVRGQWARHLRRSGIEFDNNEEDSFKNVANTIGGVESIDLAANNAIEEMDDLCIENAVMLKRCMAGSTVGANNTRYPLIIDPSGKALDFIANEYVGGDRKITKTSFLDDSFRKNLESALRFGNPLLVQDVENYDPILNPVLNREIRKTGGRVLITLGDQDIDLSPSFTIFLSTRDPSAEFSPDLCSRVSLINFTLTKSSLQAQCLNRVLKAERPDIDTKRSDLLKLQGEFKLRLRHLEKNLLRVLNDAKGKSILDDDSVITTLESLKKEADEITSKMELTKDTMKEIERVSSLYTPLAMACSTVYFTMEALCKIHFLYQYSLQFFMGIFHHVLYCNLELKQIKDPDVRLDLIIKQFFNTIYVRVSRGMLYQDKIIFAFFLCRTYINGFLPKEPDYNEEFEFLIHKKDRVMYEPSQNITHLLNKGHLNTSQAESLSKLCKLPQFESLPNILIDPEKGSELLKWIKDTDINLKNIPQSFYSNSNKNIQNIKSLRPIGKSIENLLLLQAFHPDKLSDGYHNLIETVFGTDFEARADAELDLAEIIEKETDSKTHIMFCSVPGFDASSRIDTLASELKKPLTSIAIGSSEGFISAEKTINQSCKTGRWVLLKNVHLTPHWLVHLEKKLHTLNQPHPDFRLFLTMEINPKIPITLLRSGLLLTFEPPPGLRASLSRTLLPSSHSFSSIHPNSISSNPPKERARVRFLIAWWHALALERLAYVPLGWAAKHDLDDSDLASALTTADRWVDFVAQLPNNEGNERRISKSGGGKVLCRNNVDPAKLPWKAIKVLLAKCDYGAKIDNEFDRRLLWSFLGKIFDPSSFEDNFILVDRRNLLLDKCHETSNKNYDSEINDKIVTLPEGLNTDQQFYEWTHTHIPARADPTWLGLPLQAETVLKIRGGQDITRKLGEVERETGSLLTRRFGLARNDKSKEEDEADITLQQDEENDNDKNTQRELKLTHKDPIETTPKWMKALRENVSTWLDILNSIEAISYPHDRGGIRKDPLFRYAEREVKFGTQLLNDILKDLHEISALCRNQKKLTNRLRALTGDLIKGHVPLDWFRYKSFASQADSTINHWIMDFSLRMKKLGNYCETLDRNSSGHLADSQNPIWLGGLFNPEAFITATRQYSARKNSWSLEELVMDMTIYDGHDSMKNADYKECVFYITGLKLQGARSRENKLELVSHMNTDLPLISITWNHNSSALVTIDTEEMMNKDMFTIKLPLYLNQTRNEILFDVEMKTKAPENDPSLFYERGVAFICS